MAEGGKFVMRPKVRFCQTETDEEDHELNINQRISDFLKKPSIKSIISIEKPYKIISADEPLTSQNPPRKQKTSPEKNSEPSESRVREWENIFGHQRPALSNFDEEKFLAKSFREFISPSQNKKRLENIIFYFIKFLFRYLNFSGQSILFHFRCSVELPFSKDYNCSTDNQASSSESSFSSREDTVKNSKVVEVDVHVEDPPEVQIKNDPKNIFPEPQILSNKLQNSLQTPKILPDVQDIPFNSLEKKNLSSIQEESLESEIRPEQNITDMQPLKVPEELNLKSQIKVSEPKSPKKTFKCTSPLKKQLNSVNRLSKSSKSPKKVPPQENSKNPRLTVVASKTRSRPLGTLPRSAAKIKVAGVMPCMKAKIAAKGKTSPVKKSILRNVAVRPTKAYIGPGVVRPRKELDENFKEEPRVNPEVLDAKKLSRPEYNSIMCTINKLKQVQQENIVPNVENLPQSYKNLVNVKVNYYINNHIIIKILRFFISELAKNYKKFREFFKSFFPLTFLYFF